MVDASRNSATQVAPGTPRWVKVLGVGIVVTALVVVVVMATAGGDHGPGMHAPSGDSPVASVGSAAIGVGGPVEAGSSSRTVEITALDTLAFDPATIDVSAGETVTFVVTNAGRAVHEFTLGDTEMQQEHADAMAHLPAGMVHDLPNSVTLQPGETKRLSWQFGEAGALEYGCHEPRHFDGGMRGRIIVS